MNLKPWKTESRMVKVSRVLLRDGGLVISKTLSEILVCPLSKQPLRICEQSNSLISDATGVSFPIVDGIPYLVPNDGKIIDTDDMPKHKGAAIDSTDEHSTLRGHF